jgi:hypothetical protein
MLPPVNPRALIDELVEVLSVKGVRLSSRPFQSASTVAGGAVKLAGQVFVVIDSGAPIVEQAMALAEAICSLGIEPGVLSREARLIVAKAYARRRWRRKRLVGRALTNKVLWFRARQSAASPVLSACKDHGRRASHR